MSVEVYVYVDWSIRLQSEKCVEIRIVKFLHCVGYYLNGNLHRCCRMIDKRKQKMKLCNNFASFKKTVSNNLSIQTGTDQHNLIFRSRTKQKETKKLHIIQGFLLYGSCCSQKKTYHIKLAINRQSLAGSVIAGIGTMEFQDGLRTGFLPGVFWCPCGDCTQPKNTGAWKGKLRRFFVNGTIII